MPDISNEIAAIQVATTGSEVRSAIVTALEVINAYVPTYYSGSYSIMPGSSSIVLATENKGMYSDVVVEAMPVYGGSYIITPSTASQAFPVQNLLMVDDLLVEAVPLYSGNYTDDVFIVSSITSMTYSTSNTYLSRDIHLTVNVQMAFNVVDAVYDEFTLYSSAWSSVTETNLVQSIMMSSVSFNSDTIVTVIPMASQISEFISCGVETFQIYPMSDHWEFSVNGSSLAITSDLTLNCLLSYAYFIGSTGE